MDTSDPLVQEGKRLYGVVTNQALAGYQLIEEMLKLYIGSHFELVRALVASRLHFDFKESDFRDAALGRLVQTFSKLCADKELVGELRAVIRRRDHLAHRALLELYEDHSAVSYQRLLDEITEDLHRLAALMQRLQQATSQLRA